MISNQKLSLTKTVKLVVLIQLVLFLYLCKLFFFSKDLNLPIYSYYILAVLFFTIIFMIFLIRQYVLKPVNIINNHLDKVLDDDVNLDDLPEFKYIEFKNISYKFNKISKIIDDKINYYNQQKNEQRAILSSLHESVFVIDLDSNIIFLNQVSSELFEISQSSSIGRSIFEVIRNSELQLFFEKILNSQDIIKNEFYINHTKKFIDATGSKVYDDSNSLIGHIIIFRDISKIKKLENIRNEFVSNVSHELKTPVTAIKGYVETVQELDVPGKGMSFLKIIENHADRLNTIIDDLLLLSKIENREKINDLETKEEALSEVINLSIFDCGNLIDKNNIRVIVDCPENIKFDLNKRLLQEAFTNLINNACKYSYKNGEININVSQHKDFIEVDVIDNGIGISSKHFDRLFERFYRVDESRSRDIGGTGLGLAIVKHIVGLHNGSILVKSEIGKGTTFTIRFKLT